MHPKDTCFLSIKRRGKRLYYNFRQFSFHSTTKNFRPNRIKPTTLFYEVGFYLIKELII